MISCSRFDELLLESTEGRLPEADRVAYEVHLRTCPSCVAQLKNYVTTIEVAKGAFADGSDEVAGPLPERLVGAILAKFPGARILEVRGQEPPPAEAHSSDEPPESE